MPILTDLADSLRCESHHPRSKNRLSKLIAAAERGEEVIISRRDKPVARLSPVAAFTGSTRIGGLKGRKLRMNANFDDPALNAEIARTFDTP